MNLFVFIVDRSGSMEGEKMETTKQALILFIKSLPSDSLFEVISFGDYYKCLSEKITSKGTKIQGTSAISYTDDNVEKAIKLIKGFSASMGGTEIF